MQTVAFTVCSWTMMFSIFVKALRWHKYCIAYNSVWDTGFIVQEKSNLPIKCLKSSDCVDFTYRQIKHSEIALFVHRVHMCRVNSDYFLTQH
jgi:hypothetical protein